MKKKLLLSVISLVSLFGMVGCQNSTSNSGSDTPSSSQQEFTLNTLSISNKAELQDWFYVGDSNRSVKLNLDEGKNMSSLISSGDIKITSSDATVVMVLGAYVSPLKAGSATITVTGGGKSDSVEIYVGNPTTIVPEDTAVGVNKTMNLAIDSEKNSKTLTDYDWTSSDTTIATVANGVVTGLKAGSVTITAKLKSNNKEGAALTLTVAENVSTPVAINTLNGSSSIKEVTVWGKVVAINSNSYLIDDGTGAIMVYKSCSFSLGDSVKVTGQYSPYGAQPEIGSPTAQVKVGKKFNNVNETATPLTAEILKKMETAKISDFYTYGKKYSWKASAEMVSGFLALNLSGYSNLLEPVKLNEKKFPYKVGHYYSVEGYWTAFKTSSSGKYHSFVITKLTEATPETTLVFLSDTTLKVDAKNTRKLSASYILSDADKDVKTITWTSSDPKIATVNQNGVVTGVSVSKEPVTITATVGGGSASCKVTVVDEVALTNIGSITKTGLVRVRGVVKNVGSNGYMIADATGAIYVQMHEAKLLYSVGDYLEVTSTVCNYKGALVIRDKQQSDSKWGVLDEDVYKLDVEEKDLPNTAGFDAVTPLTNEILTSLNTAAFTTSATKKYSWTIVASGNKLTFGDSKLNLVKNGYTNSSIVLKDTYKYKIEGYFLGKMTKESGDSTTESLEFVLTSATMIDQTRIDFEKTEATIKPGVDTQIGFAYSVSEEDSKTLKFEDYASLVNIENSNDEVASFTKAKDDNGNWYVNVTPKTVGTTTLTASLKKGGNVIGTGSKIIINVTDSEILTGKALKLTDTLNESEKSVKVNKIKYSYLALLTKNDYIGFYGAENQKNSTKKNSYLRNSSAFSKDVTSVSFKFNKNYGYGNNDLIKVEFSAKVDMSNAETHFISTVKGKKEFEAKATGTGFKYVKISYADTEKNKAYSFLPNEIWYNF